MSKKTTKNQRRKPVQARAKAKYAAILAAAPRVLAAKGYQGATTEEIALEADVSIGTLYEYFRNKDAVFAAYLKQQLQQVMEEMATEVQLRLQQSPERIIEQLVQLGVSFIFRRQQQFSVLMREIPGLWEIHVVQKLEARILAWAELIFLQQQLKIDKPEFKQVVNMLTHTVVGLYMRMTLVGPEGMSEQTVAREILFLLTGYIERRTGIRLALPS